MHDHRNLPSLGAMLFVPTVLPQGARRLVEIGNGEKFGNLRTVIFDLEDSLRDEDVPQGMANLKQALTEFASQSPVRKFVRVRDPENLSMVLKMPCIDRIQGFVLPKFDTTNLRDYFTRLPGNSKYAVMPILETIETFNQERLLKLRDLLDGSNLSSRSDYGRSVQCILIGAMDLLKLLRIQPDIKDTIYDTVLASVIDQIVTIFTPSGYKISGTIFRGFGPAARKTLQDEVRLDMKRGMFSKLAIHPDQLSAIEDQYAVDIKEVLRAAAILAPDAPGVFKMMDEMCEPATQASWAKRIFARLLRFGIAGGEVFEYASPDENEDSDLNAQLDSLLSTEQNLNVKLTYEHIELIWSQRSGNSSPDSLNFPPLSSYQTAIRFARELGL